MDKSPASQRHVIYPGNPVYGQGVGVCQLSEKQLQTTGLRHFYTDPRRVRELSDYNIKTENSGSSCRVDLSEMSLADAAVLSCKDPAFKEQQTIFLKAKMHQEMNLIEKQVAKSPKNKAYFEAHKAELKQLLFASQDLRTFTRAIPALALAIDEQWQKEHEGAHFPAKPFASDCRLKQFSCGSAVEAKREAGAAAMHEDLLEWQARRFSYEYPVRHKPDVPILEASKQSFLSRVLNQALHRMLGLTDAPTFVQLVPSHQAIPVAKVSAFKDGYAGLNLTHGKHVHQIHLFGVAQQGLLSRDMYDFILDVDIWDSFFDRNYLTHDMLLTDGSPQSNSDVVVKGMQRLFAGNTPHNITRMLLHGQLSALLHHPELKGDTALAKNVLLDWFGVTCIVDSPEGISQTLVKTARQIEVMETYLRDSTFKALDKIAKENPYLDSCKGMEDEEDKLESAEDLFAINKIMMGDSILKSDLIEIARHKALKSFRKGYRVMLTSFDTSVPLRQAQTEDDILQAEGFVIYKKTNTGLSSREVTHQT